MKRSKRVSAMLLKLLTQISLLMAVYACASNPAANHSETSALNGNDRVQTHLVDQNIPQCDSCVVGSIGDSELKNSNKKVYFLYGAEHLNLQNYYFDIPVVYNAATKKWINYFTGRGRELYKRYATRAGRYAPVLSKILNDQGMPRDLIYLAMAESGFQNHARSWAKAVGPWQFMPFTGRKFGLEIDFFVDERRDPLKATMAASRYLKTLYELFGSWELAAAGYNAGEGKIGRAIRRYQTKNFWKMRRYRYLRSETKNYVPKIMALAIISKNLGAFGFTGDDKIEFDRALDFQEIKVPGNSDLYKVAEVLGIDFEEVKRYNPELVRWQTPPTQTTYTLRVPVGKKHKWTGVTDPSVVAATDYKVYQLRGRGTLKHVARKFKVPSAVLEQINGIDVNQKLFPKTAVYLPFREDHRNRKHPLYADLYERPRKSVRRRRTYKRWINKGVRSGKHIANPSEFYVVKKGDTLWTIAKKKGVNINTLIRSNMKIVKRRMILPGDKLAIR